MNMTNKKTKRYIKTGVMLASLLAVGACSAHSGQHRAQHNSHHRPSVQVMFEYDYYPDQHVYFDRHNSLYHYHHADRGWLTVSILPRYIQLNHHRRQHLSYNHNRPWKERHVNKHYNSHHEPRHYNRHEQRYDRRHDRREYRREYRRQQQHRNEQRGYSRDKRYGHSNERRGNH